MSKCCVQAKHWSGEITFDPLGNGAMLVSVLRSWISRRSEPTRTPDFFERYVEALLWAGGTPVTAVFLWIFRYRHVRVCGRAAACKVKSRLRLSKASSSRFRGLARSIEGSRNVL